MSYLPILIAIALVSFAFLYHYHIHSKIEIFLRWLGAMPKSTEVKFVPVARPPFSDKGNVFDTLRRTLALNWYVVIMLTLLWVILFKSDVGEDMITDYISNLYDTKGQWFYRASSLFFLSLLLFVKSLTIWIIPFFLINLKNSRRIRNKPVSYYLGTKILSLMAMVVYAIVGSAFLAALCKNMQWPIGTLLLNLLFIVLFFLLQRFITWFTNTSVFRKINLWRYKMQRPIRHLQQDFIQWLAKSKWGMRHRADKWVLYNQYVNILVWILFWHIVLVIFIASLLSFFSRENDYYYILPFFILGSSTIVFRQLYYLNDSNLNAGQVVERVENMLSPRNRRHAKVLYKILAFILGIGMLAYLFLPSLAGTNTLYVVLLVFAFIIIYLDYMRRLLKNSRYLLVRIIAGVAILVFIVMPFYSPDKQFNVPLVDYMGKEKKTTLDRALEKRIAFVNRISDTGNIYVVCGMGGGSRAGYVTAGTLALLESWDSLFLAKTIFYSTISGSSPGVYHYLKGRKSKIATSDFLYHVYQRNYNSSGVFGVLFADACEAFLGKLITWPMLFRDTMPVNGYYDRNVRIRSEYEIALQQGLEKRGGTGINYFDRTFKRYDSVYVPDAFEYFYQQQPGALPVHFINTFEINSGRRTVISPFEVKDTNVFNNAIMLLQDTSFSCGIARKDIMYRDATNLSELFPFLSGASSVGNNKYAQFVDGGYFENYGLATAWDVVEYIRKLDTNAAKRIKIILIKSSKQEPHNDNKSLQLIAPLVGAMQSPFTGHANHFLQFFKNRYDTNHFHVMVFDDEKYHVPLTRALTRKHIQNMNQFFEDTADASEAMRLRAFIRR